MILVNLEELNPRVQLYLETENRQAQREEMDLIAATREAAHIREKALKRRVPEGTMQDLF